MKSIFFKIITGHAGGLRQHNQRNHDERFKNNACRYCGKIYSDPKNLKNHEAFVHLQKDIYVCPLCNKSCSSAATLLQHKKVVHEGIRLQCKFCEKSFTASNTLKYHVDAVHKGIKHVCVFCNTVITRAADLKKHLKKMHQGQKNVIPQGAKFDCEFCGKSFSRSNGKTMHIKRVHAGKEM